MKLFATFVNDFQPFTLSQKPPSHICDTVLNTPVHSTTNCKKNIKSISANICIGENKLKTSWRRLEEYFICFGVCNWLYLLLLTCLHTTMTLNDFWLLLHASFSVISMVCQWPWKRLILHLDGLFGVVKTAHRNNYWKCHTNAYFYVAWSSSNTETAYNMQEYRFSLTRILPYKDKIYGFVLILLSSHILHMNCYLSNDIQLVVKNCNWQNIALKPNHTKI